jgi:hypothetical protein
MPSDLTSTRHEIGHVLGLDHTSGLDNNGTGRLYAGAFVMGPHPSHADPRPLMPDAPTGTAGAPPDTAEGPVREAAHRCPALTPRRTVYSFGGRARA